MTTTEPLIIESLVGKTSVYRGTSCSRRSACGPNENLKERLSWFLVWYCLPIVRWNSNWGDSIFAKFYNFRSYGMSPQKWSCFSCSLFAWHIGHAAQAGIITCYGYFPMKRSQTYPANRDSGLRRSGLLRHTWTCNFFVGCSVRRAKLEHLTHNSVGDQSMDLYQTGGRIIWK